MTTIQKREMEQDVLMESTITVREVKYSDLAVDLVSEINYIKQSIRTGILGRIVLQKCI